MSQPQRVDRLLKVAHIAALLWIGYELHSLAYAMPDVGGIESALNSIFEALSNR